MLLVSLGWAEVVSQFWAVLCSGTPSHPIAPFLCLCVSVACFPLYVLMRLQSQLFAQCSNLLHFALMRRVIMARVKTHIWVYTMYVITWTFQVACVCVYWKRYSRWLYSRCSANYHLCVFLSETLRYPGDVLDVRHSAQIINWSYEGEAVNTADTSSRTKLNVEYKHFFYG